MITLQSQKKFYGTYVSLLLQNFFSHNRSLYSFCTEQIIENNFKYVKKEEFRYLYSHVPKLKPTFCVIENI